MGLGDLFKPKWKHPDYNVRKVAVEKLDNQTLLAEIAKTDQSSLVRWTAVHNLKLTDQFLLAEIAKTDKVDWVRIAAAKKLIDKSLAESIFAEIVRESRNEDDRISALENLTDKKALAYIAKNYHLGLRVRAIEKITDDSVLADIAMNDEAECQRDRAVKKISNKKFLFEIAVNSTDMVVSRYAAKQICEPELLAEIAKTAKTYVARVEALEDTNLTNQFLLAEIAKTDKVDWVRKTAAQKLPENHPIRQYVFATEETVKTQTEKHVLAEIAKLNRSVFVRMHAVDKLTVQDQPTFAYVAANEDEEWAYQKVIKKLTDQDLVMEIVMKTEDSHRRWIAVGQLTEQADQARLADIAKNDKLCLIRRDVVNLITDQALLAKIAKEDQDSLVRSAAEKRLEGLKNK